MNRENLALDLAREEKLWEEDGSSMMATFLPDKLHLSLTLNELGFTNLYTA